MKHVTTLRLLSLALLLALAAPAFAQPAVTLPNWRPYDQKGVPLFEPSKEATGGDETRLRWGVAFTQQIQNIDHSNEATPVVVGGVNTNQLIDIGWGSNLATANLNLDALLADGIRVNLITYLSSRHHPEAWVKGGYLQVDRLPMLPQLDPLFEYTTLRVGHMEINYGDAHFRRTDNGNALYNPFVGNLIMDSFTTEVGAEVYVQSNGLLAMVGATGGEIQGGVTRPDDRELSFLGKLGFDRQLNDALRVRLTGSVYTTSGSARNTLYAGDRTGSRYYLAMENTTASTSANFTSGRINPGLTDNVTALMVNPFVKFGGLELFGVVEQAKGKAANETDDRTWNQYAAEAVYRFLPREQLYVGARYNTVSGKLAGSGLDVDIERLQVGGGWFATPSILLKLEYVKQTYDGFAPTSILHGGEFSGITIEGVVAF